MASVPKTGIILVPSFNLVTVSCAVTVYSHSLTMLSLLFLHITYCNKFYGLMNHWLMIQVEAGVDLEEG